MLAMRGVQPVIVGRMSPRSTDASSNRRGSRDALGRARRALAPRPAERATVARSASEHDRSYRAAPRGSSPHPQRKHRVTNAAGIDLTYFDNGDVQTRSGAVVGGEQEFEYTGFHLPKRVVVGPPSGPQVVTFEYDADQQRAIKTSPLGQRVYATDGYERFTPTSTGPHAFAGETLEHIYKVALPNGLMAQVVRGESNGHLVGQTTLYVHPDEQGSPALIRDDSGITHATPLWNSSGAADGDATWASTTDPLARTIRTTYTGHEYDEELGLTNMGGRMYDQSVGRFLQPDPFVQAPFDTQGLNRYSYALNSPLNLTDPTGFDYSYGAGSFTLDTIVVGRQGHQASSSSNENRGRPDNHSSNQTSNQTSSENRGRPAESGTSPSASNSASGTGADRTGGDSNRGRPDSPAGPRPAPNAVAAQSQNGPEHNGDFTPRRAHQTAGTSRTPAGDPDWGPTPDTSHTPNGYELPSVPTPLLNNPAFKIRDTSNAYRNAIIGITIIAPALIVPGLVEAEAVELGETVGAEGGEAAVNAARLEHIFGQGGQTRARGIRRCQWWSGAGI
jgi:RHS repeat-associated protein